MMRFLMVLLLVLNLATLAWQWDAFARWGWGPHTAREPERVLNQLRPETLKVETPEAHKQRMAAQAAVSENAPTPAVSAPDSPTPAPASKAASTASP